MSLYTPKPTGRGKKSEEIVRQRLLHKRSFQTGAGTSTGPLGTTSTPIGIRTQQQATGLAYYA